MSKIIECDDFDAYSIVCKDKQKDKLDHCDHSWSFSVQNKIFGQKLFKQGGLVGYGKRKSATNVSKNVICQKMTLMVPSGTVL